MGPMLDIQASELKQHFEGSYIGDGLICFIANMVQ